MKGVTLSHSESPSLRVAGRQITLPSWRTLAVAGGAALLVALVAGAVLAWSMVQARRGTAAYVETLARAGAHEGPQTPPELRELAIRDLERVLGEHPSNAMAPQAAYTLGNLRFAAGQYDRARGAYQLAAAGAGRTTLATLARAGIGLAWEAERKFPEAAAAFQSALADLTPASFHYGELLTALGRVQEAAGQKEAAIATYRRILKDAPKSARVTEVRQKLASLGATP